MSTTRSAEAEAWERAWLDRARARAGCDAERRTIDPGIEVGILADGTIRFWCFHMEAPRMMETHCVTRLAGSDVLHDALVEHEDDVIGFDPSVSLLGRGETMTVFVAYEASDGVRMRVSADGGRTFSEAGVAGGPGAHLPSVLARVEDGATRVDLLYITQSDWGNELHVRHWDDFGLEPPRDYRLAGAGAEGEFEEGLPGEPGYVPGTYVEKQVAWFGYDATLSGDDVVVVYVEEMIDYYRIFGLDDPVPGDPMPVIDDNCGCVPPPDPLYLRTLKLVRLD